MRILVLCSHNSARSQMAEGWLRRHAADARIDAEVWSAGTEKTLVKQNAITVMGEVGIDLGSHSSKTLWELPDPWGFDLVLTVCDSANETCPSYPVDTVRVHVGVPDPSGGSLERWREVRDLLGEISRRLIAVVGGGGVPDESALTEGDGP